MNKKFITLCVSALLAGGMVTPAFATLTVEREAYEVTNGDWKNWKDMSPYFYYVIKTGDQSIANPADYDMLNVSNLKATFEGYSYTKEELSGYTLWRFIPHKGANGIVDGYQIVNAYGIPLAISEVSAGNYRLDPKGSINVFEMNGGYQLKAVGYNVYIYLKNNTELAAGYPTASDKNLQVGVYCPTQTPYADTELESVFDGYFGLQIGKYNDKNEFEDYTEKYGLKGNVFTGKLTTAKTSDLEIKGLTLPTLTNNETLLMNENNKFIVLLNQVWNDANTNLDNTDLKGYKFGTMSAKALGEAIIADNAQSDPKKHIIKSYIFRVAGLDGHLKDVNAPLEVAVKMNMTAPATGTPLAYPADTWAELQVAGVDGNYYLTTAKAADAADLDLSEADYVNTTYVRFGLSNYVSPTTFWGAAWNITRNDNKTPNPSTTTDWVDKREVGYTVPEGQWILREVNGAQNWVNRETGATLETTFPFTGLRATDTPNVYAMNGYTYTITKAVDLADADRFDYFGYDAKETSTGVEETYKVVFDSQLTGEPVYISMDGVGELHLTNDPTEAIEFHVDTIKTTDDAAVVNDLGRNANADVFDIFNTYMGKDKDGNWVEKEDTVSYYRYTLSHDGKYLHYSETDNKFVLNEPVYNNGNNGLAGSVDKQGKSHLVYTEDALMAALNTTDADDVQPYIVDAFVIKEKGGDLLNILNVNNDDYDNYFTYPGTKYDDFAVINDKGKVVGVNGSKFLAERAKMMYFDFNFDEARQQQNIYNWVSNAQLQLDYQDYNIYRNVAPTAPDTMAIYRTEYQDEFLFEKNGFLGMTVDDRGYNAALFIDTAYVRNNTEKPLFMIGLRPEITPETVYCPIHGVDAGCAHEHLDTIPGYVDADYLTVLADSSAFHAAELDNKFLANKAYTKLSFVAARHNVDTITVAADGNKTTISQNVQHPMVFAFRIVDQATQDFIIEGVDLTNNKAPLSAGNPYKTSWMRWNNGVPVMTDIMEDAEVFNIAGDLENANPTANEEIAAEATVSVVATDGAVIVKGAEGKNVIVSTILGKVVANEVLTSDNETIAAPAGIVVVSVDGESFKVAVK